MIAGSGGEGEEGGGERERERERERGRGSATALHHTSLPHSAHCNTLQRTAAHCNTLQHTALQHTPVPHSRSPPRHTTHPHTHTPPADSNTHHGGVGRGRHTHGGLEGVWGTVMNGTSLRAHTYTHPHTHTHTLTPDIRGANMASSRGRYVEETHCNTLQHAAPHCNTHTHVPSSRGGYVEGAQLEHELMQCESDMSEMEAHIDDLSRSVDMSPDGTSPPSPPLARGMGVDDMSVVCVMCVRVCCMCIR